MGRCTKLDAYAHQKVNQQAVLYLLVCCSGWSDTLSNAGHTLYGGDHLLANAVNHVKQVLQQQCEMSPLVNSWRKQLWLL